jgi:hypothetical protein
MWKKNGFHFGNGDLSFNQELYNQWIQLSLSIEFGVSENGDWTPQTSARF